MSDFSVMIDPASLATSDPLGIGGLLVDAYRLSALVRAGVRRADPRLLDAVLAAASQGMRHFVNNTDLTAPANLRLGFRELGLIIGFAAFERIDRSALSPGAQKSCAEIARLTRFGRDILGFWIYPENRAAQSWVDHQDINDVMLATSLAPDGFLRRG